MFKASGLLILIIAFSNLTTSCSQKPKGADAGTASSDDSQTVADDTSIDDTDSDLDSDTGFNIDTYTNTDTELTSDSNVDTGTRADTATEPDTFSDSGSGSDTESGSDTDSLNPDSDIGSDTHTDEDTETVFDTESASDAQPDTDTNADAAKCKVPENEFGSIDKCTEIAPPKSFEPDIQWSWAGYGEDIYAMTTPLVAELTDDDHDGDIDLCDTPDVVVVASGSVSSVKIQAHIYVLDGATGTLHFRVETPVDYSVTPAVGDIDNDGLSEIITADIDGYLLAFEHDGTFKWRSTARWIGTQQTFNDQYGGAVALADLDEDGDVEIITGNMVTDHRGIELWTSEEPSGSWSATTAANLDGEPGLEVVLGHAAYHGDGSLYYLHTDIYPGYPQIADLDDDGLPEVLVTDRDGISLLENDGTVKYVNLRPTGAAVGYTTWVRPATIHDFDGDGFPEFAMSSSSEYTLYESDASIIWSAPVSDESGIAAGTAFDFLGDGTAEAMYADEYSMFIFDENGAPLLQIPRSSGTLTEYPVVADVDNDGSAEIVVVSSSLTGAPGSPTVQVIRDVADRWIQARRIWNQHTYHVTNVREDGTIPRVEPKSWELFNTFRTNIQVEQGTLCVPPVV